jgi:hypothetical protein
MYWGGTNPCSGFGHQKIPKFADVCVKGCMYRLFFKPDEEVIKVKMSTCSQMMIKVMMRLGIGK